MKEINVEICVCAKCVMNGCMDTIESIESLKTLKTQTKMKNQIVVTTTSGIGDVKCAEKSPVASINGTIIEHANSQTVMSKIMSLISKDVKCN